MTQHELEAAVARSLSEPIELFDVRESNVGRLRTIRALLRHGPCRREDKSLFCERVSHRGFSEVDPDDDDRRMLCLDCPECGSQIFLADEPAELPEIAECQRCAQIFDYLDDEVYEADALLDV